MSRTAFEVGQLDAIDQAQLVASGQCKPAELVEWAIERAEALDPALHSIVYPLYDHARSRVAAGVDGPLAGVPMVLKDLVAELAGTPFAEASRYVDGLVSTFTSEIVERFQRAGLVVIGKSNAPEFGMAPHAEPALHGATHNPWSLTHSTSGSSGGSAAAVAAGIVPIGHANDLGGSIRYPAANCGLFGLKPARGRTSLGPEYGDAANGGAVEHVVTRSVRDSAAVLDCVSGPAVGDPYWAPPPDRLFLDEVRAPTGLLRVAYIRRTREDTDAHPDCLAGLDATLALLEGLGHEVVEDPVFDIAPSVGEALGTMFVGFAAWVVDYWTARLGRGPKEGELEPLTQSMMDASRNISASQYLLAVTELQRFTRRVVTAMQGYDVLLNPTMSTPPLELGQTQRGGETVRYAGVVANVTGLPAMSVPLHWNEAGLPIGMHFLGQPNGEAALLRLAAQLEHATPWADRWPPTSVAAFL